MKKTITLRAALYIALLFSTISIFAVASCGPTRRESEVKQKLNPTDVGGGYQIITIDECEYIAYTSGAAHSLTHKANCKNWKAHNGN